MIAAILLLAAAPAQLSWGKPGVTMTAYRDDANLCASRAWNADILDTEAVKVFRDGTQQIDAIADVGSSSPAGQLVADTGTAGIDPIALNRHTQIARIVEAARPKERMQEVRAVQQRTLATCLRSLGYVRFALTEGQRKRLSKLKRGSDARHAYLHGLASDAAVLAAQTVPVVSPR